MYSLVPDQVFEHFLAGETLEECYAAVAAVANRWLDLLDTQALLLPTRVSCHICTGFSIFTKKAINQLVQSMHRLRAVTVRI